METKALKKQLGAAIAMVLVAAIALGAATFAWFVNNNAVTATGVDVSTSSAVPNLYITSAGKTTDGMTPARTNPSKLLPVSTKDGINFFDTKHWTGAADNNPANHAFADQYKIASTEGDDKTAYFEYSFKLGVTNGSMDVYFDSDTDATNLVAASSMGTAGRFAISFSNVQDDDGNPVWTLFKVKANPDSTATKYYTDKAAETATLGDDYWVTNAGKADVVTKASYSSIAEYSGSINNQGQAVKGNSKLTTIDKDQEVTVTVRVWYEGCDPACVSENAQNGIASAVKGNLGFVGVQPTATTGVGA